jgi:hypothetical protein
MFREPEDEVTTDKIAAKVDKTAATSRSAIRRESTVRSGRYNAISSPRSRNAARSHLLQDYRSRATRNRSVAESDEAELEAELERLRRRREARSRIRWGSLNENDDNDTERRLAGEELLRDALHYDRPGQRLRLLRPPRESALRFEVAPSPPLSDSLSPSTSPRERTFTRPYIPSPPYSLNDHRGNRIPPDGPVPITGPIEFTPGFAPARGVYRDLDPPSGDLLNTRVDPTANTGGDLPDLETPPPETWEASYPPLRRVGHLSPRSYSFRHDGLGDRQRSPMSPGNGSNAEEDTWETLLTTMEEDENQPSAASSFTSAIASASTSRRSNSTSRSGHSSQTAATSFADLDAVDAGQPCESDNEFDEAPLAHDPSASTMIRRARIRHERHLPQSPSLHDELPAIGRMHDTVRETVASAERRAAAAEERLRRIESHAAATEAELAQMQSFIDRLARREDIPNELWAAAGLSRINRENQ